MDADEFPQWFYDHYTIHRLKYRYCYCIDEGQIPEFENLFVEDAVVDFATREPYEGRDEIRGFLEEHVTEADRMAHMVTNPLIVVDGGTATGKWDYIVFLAGEDGTELGQGVYHETYRRVGRDWKFERIRTERRFTHTV